MEMVHCPNCGKVTGHKRALGFGTFFAAVITAGLWIFALPFYPKHCTICSTRRAQGRKKSQKGIVSQGSGQIIYSALKKEMSGPKGKRIMDILIESCARTALTSGLTADVIKYIEREALKGRRAESVAISLRKKLPEKSAGELQSIAACVISKFGTARSRIDSEDLGLHWYKWKTSKDARVRNSHAIMDGVLINWNDPPAPEVLNGEESCGNYHAGETEGCRCYPESVIILKQLQSPIRAHAKGKIVSLTKEQFERIY